MLLDTINRKLAEQYARETRARTVLRIVPTPKIRTEKSAMYRDPSMPRTVCKPARSSVRAAVAPPAVPHDLQDDPDVRVAAPAPEPDMRLPPPMPLPWLNEQPETLPAPTPALETKPPNKGTVKAGCITVGLPLPKEMHAIFKARALAKGTSIKHEVLLSLGRDLG